MGVNASSGYHELRDAVGDLCRRYPDEYWRRIDGEWLFHRDIWNSSVQLPEED